MPSGCVGLPQVGGIVVSEYVALRRPLPGGVVTWFVTGSTTGQGSGGWESRLGWMRRIASRVVADERRDDLATAVDRYVVDGAWR